jgi:anti-sigma regulatory factor (Ser/Thr protein kinase)
MSGVHELASQLPMPEMATLLYLVYDPTTRQLRYTNAGHPPALVFDATRSTFLRRALGPPIGVTADPTYVEATYQLPPGATVLLYTDGLVERRGKSIWQGLARLRSEVEPTAAPHDVDAQDSTDLDALCDRLLSTLLDQHHVPDDVALVAMRPQSSIGGPLHINLPAEARMLAHMRVAVRRWLHELDVAAPDVNDVLVACSEACSNVVQHAYGTRPGDMEVSASLDDGTLVLVVRDTGQWRPAAGRGGGWGLQLMRALMDSVEVEQSAGGTEVKMRRHVQIGEAP